MLVRIHYETPKLIYHHDTELQYIPSVGTILEINPRTHGRTMRVVVQSVLYTVDESEFIKTVRSARNIIEGTHSGPPQIELFTIEECILKHRRTFFQRLKAILYCEI